MKINWNPDEHMAKIDALKEKRHFLLNTFSKYQPAKYLEALKLNHQIWELEMEKVSLQYLERLENFNIIDLHGMTIDEAEHILYGVFDYMSNKKIFLESMEIITGRGTLRLYNWVEKNLGFIILDYDYPKYKIQSDINNYRFTIKFT